MQEAFLPLIGLARRSCRKCKAGAYYTRLVMAMKTRLVMLTRLGYVSQPAHSGRNWVRPSSREIFPTQVQEEDGDADGA